MTLLVQYRGLGKSQRPGAVLHGCTPEDLAPIKQLRANVLLVSGQFGSGKGTLIRRLLRTGKYINLTGHRTRPPRVLELNGSIPYKRIGYRELFDPKPCLVIANMRPLLEYRKWENRAKKYGIKLPNPDDDGMGAVLREMLSIYYLSDIIEVCQRALREGKVVLIETTPWQEKVWIGLLPRLRVLRLKTKPEEIVRRIEQRRGSTALIRRIKTLVSLEMSSGGIRKARVVRNDTWKDFGHAYRVALEMYAPSRTWSLLAWLRITGRVPVRRITSVGAAA